MPVQNQASIGRIPKTFNPNTILTKLQICQNRTTKINGEQLMKNAVAINLNDKENKNNEGNPFFNKTLEFDKEFTRLAARKDASSEDEVLAYINDLPDLSSTLDRGCGEALWYLSDNVARRIEYSFRQKCAGNWEPYLMESKDPDASQIFSTLDRLERISQSMAKLNEASKPIVLKLAKDYFANPAKYKAVPMENYCSILLNNLPAAGCLPEVLRGRILSKVLNLQAKNLCEEEMELIRILDKFAKLDNEYIKLYCFELYNAVDRYIERHPDSRAA